MILYIAPILAVLLGFLFVVIIKPQQKKNLKLLLAFSGAFLLGITIFEMLPSIFNVTEGKTIGLFVALGILLQICLEFFSKGAEHGHVHVHSESKQFPLLLFISLSLHSLIEGTPLHEHQHILYGVIIHKIPIAIILTTFFFNSSIKRTSGILFLLLFSLMTPLGTYLMTVIPEMGLYANYIHAVAVGIFLHISTTILFESNEGHKFNLAKLIIIIIGLSLAYII